MVGWISLRHNDSLVPGDHGTRISFFTLSTIVVVSSAMLFVTGLTSSTVKSSIRIPYFL
jgi:hypothetical protein